MTCSELHRDESENALPERFWHRVQLQAVTIAGAPSTVMLSCPHWQVAVRIPSYLMLPSLSEIIRPPVAWASRFGRCGSLHKLTVADRSALDPSAASRQVSPTPTKNPAGRSTS